MCLRDVEHDYNFAILELGKDTYIKVDFSTVHGTVSENNYSK